MANNDTAALVVALSAQLTKFEKDMQRAGVMADQTVSGIEDRFAKLNPSVAASFLGNLFSNFSTKGIEAAIQFVTDLRDRFLELPAVANLVGQSLNDVWGFQEAASKSKVSIDDSTKSLKGLAVLLDGMQRGEKNSLSALFDVNPAALQGVNREALTLQQTFGIVADLVQNARTEVQKIDIAQAAGQAESMVKFLQQGGAAVTRLSNDAAAAAPNLQKLADSAKEFDDAWRAAVTKVKAYLAENMFEVIKQDLTDVIALLGGAVRFLQLFRGGLIDSSTQSAAAEVDKLRGALLRFKAARDQIDESSGLNTSANARDDQRVFFGPLDGKTPIPRQNGTSTADRNRALSNVPSKNKPETGPEKDSFGRTEEQITRHTATLNADTIAVFQNNAAQAQLRAEFQLLNAIRKDEGEVTQAQIDQYQKLRATMTAEQALVQSHIQLSPAHKASFISASEGAATATTNYDKARDSLNKLNSASSQIGSALSSAFADAVVEGKSLNDVMGSLVKTLEKAAINSVFASFFNPGAGGGLAPAVSLTKSLFGFETGGFTGNGGASEPAGVVHGKEFVVNAEATAKNRSLLEAINRGVPGFKNGGYVGSFVTPASAASANGGGGKSTIVFNDNAGVKVQTQEVIDGRGNRDISITIDQAVAGSMSRPGSATRGALQNNFGAKPVGVRR